LPPPPCATAATEEINRSRKEGRQLRWVGTTPEKLCCVGAQSVVEMTRTTEILKGKDKGKVSLETVYYVSTLPMVPANAMALLLLIRSYWGIESGHHYRLDVTAMEDASRVRHRNSLLVLGNVRRIVMGLFYGWRAARKNKRQSTLKDFHDTMNRHQHREAWRLIKA
jgi:predicted transposase YbfD/YdcC